MSTPFQNRLVGTTIVAAIAIIFLPDLLSGNKKKHNAEFENIPQAPEIEMNMQMKEFPQDKLNPKKLIDNNELELDLDIVEQDDALNSVEPFEEELTSSTTSIVNNGKVKVQTVTKKVQSKSISTQNNDKKLPEKINIKETWVIQLGSFRHQKNVSALVDKLKYHGYLTFTKPIQTNNGTLTKVFIGPNINKSALEKKIGPLKSLTNVQGKVTLFSPANM